MLLHIQALEYDMGIQKHHMLRVPGLGVPVGPLGFGVLRLGFRVV